MCSPNAIRKQGGVNRFIEAGPDKEFDALRDTQDVGEDASVLKFFAPSSNQSNVRQDYQHPLPYDHAVVAARAVSTVAVIRSTDLTAVDPHEILNELREAQVVVTGNNGDKVIDRIDLDKVMNLDEAHVTHGEVGADGDGSDEWVLHLPSGGYYPLDQGFNIVAGDDYGAEIRFENGGAFPAADAYEGKQLGIKLDLKVIVPAVEE